VCCEIFNCRGDSATNNLGEASLTAAANSAMLELKLICSGRAGVKEMDVEAELGMTRSEETESWHPNLAPMMLEESQGISFFF